VLARAAGRTDLPEVTDLGFELVVRASTRRVALAASAE
jgi:hypothetical protein